MRFLKSERVLQIDELAEELMKDNPDWGMVCGLFVEMFEDLNSRITAIDCVEISKFFWNIIADFDSYIELPNGIHDLVGDAATLYLYPSRFCEATPEKLLKEARKLAAQYRPSTPRKSRRKRIIEMYEAGKPIASIAEELEVQRNLVEKTLILAGHKIESGNGWLALESHSLWPFDRSARRKEEPNYTKTDEEGNTAI